METTSQRRNRKKKENKKKKKAAEKAKQSGFQGMVERACAMGSPKCANAKASSSDSSSGSSQSNASKESYAKAASAPPTGATTVVNKPEDTKPRQDRTETRSKLLDQLPNQLLREQIQVLPIPLALVDLLDFKDGNRRTLRRRLRKPNPVRLPQPT